MFRAAALVTLVATVFTVAPTVVMAQAAVEGAAQPVEQEKTVIRAYDLSDLFRVPRSYPLPPSMVPATRLPDASTAAGAGGGGGGGQSLFGGGGAAPSPYGDPAQPAATAGELSQLIMSTVDPESWREAGGAVGSVRFIGTRLVVAQTTANQKQIEDLLNGIREESGPTQMVAVQAHWVHFTPDDLRAIAGKAGEASAVLKEVPDAMLADAKVYSRGQTLGFNGQTVHVSSGRANTVITGMEPIVAQQSVGYSLETATVQSGVALQVTPQVLGEGKFISLDLHSVVSEVHGGVEGDGLPDPRPLTADGPATRPAVTATFAPRAHIVAQQFSTTARIPVGKRILIGGMTFDPGAAADGSKQLYLVVEANAIK